MSEILIPSEISFIKFISSSGNILSFSIDPKLNFTFSSPQKKIVDVAMSNTFVFGGHNACVIFRKLD